MAAQASYPLLSMHKRFFHKGGESAPTSRSSTTPHFCTVPAGIRGVKTHVGGLSKSPNYILERGKRSAHNGSWRLVSASAGAASAAPSLFDPAHRAELAEEYGYTQIGEPLPPNVTLQHLIATIPPEAFKITEWKAWRGLAVSVSAWILGLYVTAIAPWYLLPFAWAWTGTAVGGFFDIAHECGHKVFSRNKLVEDIVGNLVLLPLLYPFEPWRIKHDLHHAKTNMLHEDSAWIPVERDEFDNYSPVMRTMYVLLMGPLRVFGTIFHWIDRHFFLDKFRPKDQPRVKRSIALVLGATAIGWPLLIYFTGIQGWVNFWLMPWLGFHFWMSTITMLHHSSPHIKFQPVGKWHNAQAHLVGTVNCEFPKLLEFLAHDINVHVPHHISPKIPFYNLRLANDALRQNWGKHFNEARWNWRLMKMQLTQCHVYDEDKGYVPFDHGRKQMFLLEIVRKLMPSHMA